MFKAALDGSWPLINSTGDVVKTYGYIHESNSEITFVCIHKNLTTPATKFTVIAPTMKGCSNASNRQVKIL